eukprot:4774311-Prymnesium_polylepis.1
MKRLAAMGRWWRWTAIVLMPLACASRADSVVDPHLQALIEDRHAAMAGQLPSLEEDATHLGAAEALAMLIRQKRNEAESCA